MPAEGPHGFQHPKQKWVCRTCKGRDGKPFVNFAENTACHLCHVAKGKCHAGAATETRPPHVRSEHALRRQHQAHSSRQPCDGIAERQVRQSLEAESAAAKREAAALRKELHALKGTCTGADGGGSVGAPSTANDPEVVAQLVQVKARIKMLEGIPVEHRDVVPCYAEALAAKHAEAKELGERLRSSRPLDVRLKQSQDHLRFCQGKQEKCTATLAVRKVAFDEAAKALEEQTVRLAEADAALAAAKLELASITAKAADCPVQVVGPVLTAHHVSLLENIVALIPREVFQNAVSKAGGDAQQLEIETAGVLAALKAKAQACPAELPAIPLDDDSSEMDADFDEDVYAKLQSFGSAPAAASSEAAKADRNAKAREIAKLLAKKKVKVKA